jgi:arsenite-transporting ATPase
LVISTDPAHSLGDALALRLSFQPIRVRTSRGSLQAVELDADRALGRWLRKRKQNLQTIADHGTYLDAEDVESLLQLSMPGVDEMVGLLELRRLAGAGDPQDVIVDTAPTGHTLRLLAMPSTLRRVASVFEDMQAKHHFLSQSLGGVVRPDSGDELIEEMDRQGRELIEMLRDPRRCTFAWVLLPEWMSLEETKDGIAALAQSGIAVRELIVNRVTLPSKESCAFCDGKRRAETAAVRAIRAAFQPLPIRFVPELESEPRGLGKFRAAARSLEPAERWDKFAKAPRKRPPSPKIPHARGAAVGEWLEALAPQDCRLLLFAGKGGVGKTTCAAAAALAIAERWPKRKILLLSTDPAHSLGDALGTAGGDAERPLPGFPSLRVRELDAERLFRSRRERYLASINEMFDTLQGDSRFDAVYDRAVARNLIDLSPPGLDEIFGMLSMSEALLPGKRKAPGYDFVVVDMAPTGHALRLLEMPGTALEWVHALLSLLLKYRPVTGLGDFASDLLEVAQELRQFLELLQDPKQTRLVAVLRAARLPRLETDLLLDGISKMKIAVSAILVNAVSTPGCARCRRSAARERREMDALGTAARKVLAPAVAPPPQGIAPLRRWIRSWKLMET